MKTKKTTLIELENGTDIFIEPPNLHGTIDVLVRKYGEVIYTRKFFDYSLTEIESIVINDLKKNGW